MPAAEALAPARAPLVVIPTRELMIMTSEVIMIATVIMSSISVIPASGFTRAAQVQEATVIVRDDGRFAMMEITRSIRMGFRGSMVEAVENGGPIGATAVSSIRFRRVADEDDNGTAVNEDFSVGDSPPIVYRVDSDDINGDGLTDTQLVELIDGQFSRVLANYISPVFVDENNSDSGTSAPIGGLVFQVQVDKDGKPLSDKGIQVTVITRKQVIGGPVIAARLDQLVTPRN